MVLDEPERAVAGLRAPEDAGQGVVVAWGIGSNLWSWQRAQATVRPRKACVVTSICSSARSSRNCTAVPLDVRLAAEGEEAGGDQSARRAARGRRGQQVAGDLLLDELVVRLVGVEGGDHVVAVPPGLGVIIVACLPLDSAYRATSSQCRPQRSPNCGEARSRSTTLSSAAGDGSATNASISSGVGGRPTRSKSPGG